MIGLHDYHSESASPSQRKHYSDTFVIRDHHLISMIEIEQINMTHQPAIHMFCHFRSIRYAFFSFIAPEIKHSQILHLVFLFVLLSIVNWALSLDHGNSSWKLLGSSQRNGQLTKTHQQLISLQILTPKDLKQKGRKVNKHKIVLYHLPVIRGSYGIPTF